jgi:RNA polymerase sigma-70 factor (ECF subfamily)
MADNKKKFNKIYDEYVERIYRFVYIKVSSKETAEDLTSQAFIKSWQAMERGDNIQNPKAFVYQVARNLVVDFYRDKAKHSTISEEMLKTVASDDMGIQEQAQLNADMDRTMKLLAGLKDEYRDIIIWHYLDDLSVKEIAQILTKPENNVRVTLHRAMNSLKEESKKLGLGGGLGA